MLLEEAHARYVDLCEFSPVGYLTLSREGLIDAINLTGATLLGKERKKLLQRRFAGFVAPQDQYNWRQYFMRFMQVPTKVSRESVLLVDVMRECQAMMGTFGATISAFQPSWPGRTDGHFVGSATLEPTYCCAKCICVNQRCSREALI